MSVNNKKQVSKSDSIIVKYVIDTISENPICFIPIIQTIMDPKNPDSSKLKDCISESIFKAIVNDKEIKKLCYERILENIREYTDKEILNLVNEQRVSLEEDSKEFIKHIQEQTTIKLCEKYFIDQKSKMDKIFKDYFIKLSKVIEDNMKEMRDKIQEVVVKEDGKNSAIVHIPLNMKDKVVEYVKFLKTQN